MHQNHALDLTTGCAEKVLAVRSRRAAPLCRCSAAAWSRLAASPPPGRSLRHSRGLVRVRGGVGVRGRGRVNVGLVRQQRRQQKRARYRGDN